MLCGLGHLITMTAHLYITEESAYRVLTNEGPDESHIAGVPIIMNTYELHKDNAEVVESIVTLIMELAEYGMYGHAFYLGRIYKNLDYTNITAPGRNNHIFSIF